MRESGFPAILQASTHIQKTSITAAFLQTHQILQERINQLTHQQRVEGKTTPPTDNLKEEEYTEEEEEEMFN